ncbi:hypothetical protein GT043_10135, partial [Streptomyces sp. SID2131]|nr:hypothetical protein [Streptomyces sp. SID2131]
MTGLLAFVESPVQLLNVLEWAHTRAPGAEAPATGAPAPEVSGAAAPVT